MNLSEDFYLTLPVSVQAMSGVGVRLKMMAQAHAAIIIIIILPGVTDLENGRVIEMNL